MNLGKRTAPSTRDRLLRSCWEILRDEGLPAATSRRITDVAHANLGAITYHFGSKDALIGAACVEQLRQWISPLAAALLRDEDDGGSETDVVIASLFEALNERRSDLHALLTVVIAGRELPGVLEALRDELGGFHQLVADLLARLRRRGEVPDTVDPAAMAGMFTSFALGLMVHDTLGTAPAPPLVITGQLLALLTPPERPTS